MNDEFEESIKEVESRRLRDCMLLTFFGGLLFKRERLFYKILFWHIGLPLIFVFRSFHYGIDQILISMWCCSMPHFNNFRL